MIRSSALWDIGDTPPASPGSWQHSNINLALKNQEKFALLTGFVPGIFQNLLLFKFFCYANFSIVFGPNFSKGQKSLRGANCLRGRPPVPPVEESQINRAMYRGFVSGSHSNIQIHQDSKRFSRHCSPLFSLGFPSLILRGFEDIEGRINGLILEIFRLILCAYSFWFPLSRRLRSGTELSKTSATA